MCLRLDVNRMGVNEEIERCWRKGEELVRRQRALIKN